MSKKTIASDRAPAAVGPYSQAIRHGRLIYTSGQLGLDPASGSLAAGEADVDTIVLQTRQALDNLAAVLEAAGSSLADIVKTTVFLASMDDFGTMNGVYAEYFEGAPPARSTIGVAALPLGARVEIEAVAILPKKEKKKKKEKKGKKKK